MIARTDLQPILATSHEGDFVLGTQPTAGTEGHEYVSRDWLDKTRPLADEREELSSTRSERETLLAPLSELSPDCQDERFFLRFGDRMLFPDEYAITQLGSLLGIGTHYPRTLFRTHYAGNAEVLAMVFAHAWDADADTKRLTWHVERGDRLRGVVSEAHSAVRNEWYLGVIERTIPGGRVSHWRGDSYTIYGNVLIPDTIRAETDSDYGALVAVSNSEIARRPLHQQPSLFRAICMNGCIWGREKGEKLKVSRRGVIDLAQVERQIIENIHKQIPLAVAGLDQLLKTRGYGTTVSMKPVLAQVCKDNRITKPLASAVLQAWWAERKETPDLDNTLFAVVNSFTRAGQSEPNDTWVKFDTIGGRLAQLGPDDWDSIVSRASRLTAKEVGATFERWSLESSIDISV